MSGPVIGIDVGGTFTKLVVLDAAGTPVDRSRIPTDDSPARQLAADVARELARLEMLHGPARVGVACPGLVRDDTVVWMRGRLEELQGLDWAAALGRSARVPVINDAQAALAGEVALGAGRGCRDVVLLTIGTGVGGAVMCDGRVLRGHVGRAGHLGHMAVSAPGEKDIVNTPGSLEEAIGNCSIVRRTAGRCSDTAALVAAHRQGEAWASAVWESSVQLLAAGIVSIVNAVDPARVILGGGIAMHAGESLLAPLRRWMDEYEWRPLGEGVEIVLAELGEEAGAIGAAAHARESTA
ncbi:sugar kinase [Luteitalea sp. TBR-22]|uniref:ROK family protein n=1 Tax=Luteitalea sp. TBR-22 TaxID=2802971 RepID=UPI001AF175F0|nr:ROK family protein [Luteitalea sp. TBR-22]BCS31000.1 sugar kinase [Luteitalea sp. TBR-22]